MSRISRLNNYDAVYSAAKSAAFGLWPGICAKMNQQGFCTGFLARSLRHGHKTWVCSRNYSGELNHRYISGKRLNNVHTPTQVPLWSLHPRLHGGFRKHRYQQVAEMLLLVYHPASAILLSRMIPVHCRLGSAWENPQA